MRAFGCAAVDAHRFRVCKVPRRPCPGESQCPFDHSQRPCAWPSCHSASEWDRAGSRSEKADGAKLTSTRGKWPVCDKDNIIMIAVGYAAVDAHCLGLCNDPGVDMGT